MYEANTRERECLKIRHGYTQHQIDLLDIESDKVRSGIPIDSSLALVVWEYQSNLQEIRKKKRWWQFWK